MLEESPQWQVVGEASDGREAVEKTRQLNPDLIVMGFLMPNRNGPEAAREITKLPHHPPILMLTMYMSRQLLEEARRAGIRGAVIASVAASRDVFPFCQVIQQYLHGRMPAGIILRFLM